jgi:single-strand DNA-binding protein
MNIIQIAGHLGSDPVARFTSSGKKVTSFTVATNLRKGEDTVTVWYRVTIWGDRFEKMMPYLKKGSAVMVYGELQKPEIWTDKEGRSQISLEIYAEIIRFSPFGSGAKTQERAGHTQEQSSQYSGSSGQGSSGFGEQTFGGQSQKHSEMEPEEEELPF